MNRNPNRSLLSSLSRPSRPRSARLFGAAAVAATLAAGSAASAQTVLFGDNNNPIAVASNKDLRLQVFAVGSDGAVWTSWENSLGGSFHDWASLGSVDAACLAVGQNLDGRLEVFAIDTAWHLFHAWQSSPNGGWSGFSPMNVEIGCPSVARNKDGRLEVFGLDAAAAGVTHVWQTSPGGTWSAPDFMPAVQSPDILRGLAAAANQDGRIEVFFTANDSGLYHAYQTSPGAAFGSFTKLASLLPVASTPAVGQNQDGRLEVFVTANQGASAGSVYHLWQTAPNSGWSSLTSMGGTVRGMPTVGQNSDGRLEVFARQSDGQIAHAWQVAANGGWSGWFPMGGAPAFDLGPVIGRKSDGSIFAVMQSAQYTIVDSGQSAGGWSPWSALGTNPPLVRPPAPSLNVTAGNGSATLTWTSTGTHYMLSRSTVSGQETLLRDTHYATSYTDTGLTNGTKYCYVVQTASGSTWSAPSNEVCVTPQAPPVPVQHGTYWISLPLDPAYVPYLIYDSANPLITAGTAPPAGATITSVTYIDSFQDPYGDKVMYLDLLVSNGSSQAEGVLANGATGSTWAGLPTASTFAARAYGNFISTTPSSIPLEISWQH
jgi:hypothetical protein